MAFDSHNRDVDRHNVAWKNRLNAASFAASVADTCISRFVAQGPLPADLNFEVAQQLLQIARQLPTLGTVYSRISDPTLQGSWENVLPVHAQFDRWRKAVADDREIDALASLVGTAFDLYMRDDKKSSSVANTAGRWVYTWALDTHTITEAEIEQFEIQHRIADRVTPPSENHRHAFEAVWALGKFRDAIKLLHRKAR